MKICFDYGHGGRDPGAVSGTRKEADDVLKIGRDIRFRLIDMGVQVDETRSSDYYLSLEKRVSLANSKDYDYFISFHRNAYMKNKAKGVELFLYPKFSQRSYFMAGNILRSLEDLGFKNRGIKTGNFYVLRRTRSKAILIELGFIDSDIDNRIFDLKYYDLVNQVSKAIYESLLF